MSLNLARQGPYLTISGIESGSINVGTNSVYTKVSTLLDFYIPFSEIDKSGELDTEEIIKIAEESKKSIKRKFAADCLDGLMEFNIILLKKIKYLEDVILYAPPAGEGGPAYHKSKESFLTKTTLETKE